MTTNNNKQDKQQQQQQETVNNNKEENGGEGISPSGLHSCAAVDESAKEYYKSREHELYQKFHAKEKLERWTDSNNKEQTMQQLCFQSLQQQQKEKNHCKIKNSHLILRNESSTQRALIFNDLLRVIGCF